MLIRTIRGLKPLWEAVGIKHLESRISRSVILIVSLSLISQGWALPSFRSRRIISRPPQGSQVNKSHPLARGLIGAWLFNENAGNILYSLASSPNATIQSPSSPWVQDELGPAINGTGSTTNYGIAGAGTISLPVTIVAIVRPASTGVTRLQIFAHNNGATATNGIYVFGNNATPSNLFFGSVGNAETSLTGLNFTTLNVYYFLAITVSPTGGTLNGYMGFLGKTLSTASAGAVVLSHFAATEFELGNCLNSSNNAFPGHIAEILYYNRVLSSQEINEINKNPFGMFRKSESWNWTAPAISATVTPFRMLMGVGK